MSHLPRGIGTDAGRTAVPHQHFVHFGRSDSGAADGSFGGLSAEFGGVNVLK